MVIHKCHVLEIRITMIVYDHSILLALLKQQRERPETFSRNVFRPFSVMKGYSIGP